MDIIKNASETIVNRLTWHTAERDQAGIADELAKEQEVQEIFGLDDAGLFDEFFCFLRELNIMKVLEQLVPRGHRERKNPVPFSAVMLIYLIRIVAGLKFFYHNSTDIRWPVCPEFIASFIVAIAGKTMERVFNKIISILAAKSFFPRKINALIDASDLESTERCKGRGKVTKEKGPELRRRKGRIKKNPGHGGWF